MRGAAYDLGIAGAGAVGGNLALSIADHGYSVAAYDEDELALRGLRIETQGRSIEATGSIAEFAALLGAPRTVMILAAAGPPVDRLINALVPHLGPGDLIIDAGNSYFKDTDMRSRMLAEKEIQLLGVGISEGEQGARLGASIMPGGPARAYERMRGVFHDIAAKVNGEPCVAHLGPGSAGHYVNMVHNGIERGVMQLIAETYDLMGRGLGMSEAAIREVYANWYVSEVSSSLLGILARRLGGNGDGIGASLVDLSIGAAALNGSGRWTALEASDLGVMTPTIDVAVAIQMLSSLEEGRAALRKLLGRRPIPYVGKPDVLIGQIKRALCAGMILTFSQGMALLKVASEVYGYDLALDEVARIWRGSIIRSPMLQEVYDAFYVQPHLENLLADSQFAHQARMRREDLRAVVRLAGELGMPAPAFTASLTYYDVHREQSVDVSRRVETLDVRQASAWRVLPTS